MGKVIALEYPQLRCLCIDFDKGLQKTFDITDENPICELTSESLKQLFVGGYLVVKAA